MNLPPNVNCYKLPKEQVHPEDSQIKRWRWMQSDKGMFLCYWDGGPTVDCYGPFEKKGNQDAEKPC